MEIPYKIVDYNFIDWDKLGNWWDKNIPSAFQILTEMRMVIFKIEIDWDKLGNWWDENIPSAFQILAKMQKVIFKTEIDWDKLGNWWDKNIPSAFQILTKTQKVDRSLTLFRMEVVFMAPQ